MGLGVVVMPAASLSVNRLCVRKILGVLGGPAHRPGGASSFAEDKAPVSGPRASGEEGWNLESAALARADRPEPYRMRVFSGW
ncbi:hypothetical protein Vau01_105710 [Virgisporangium aurantiacum]|uniref:Uncharacterized protein n=1 Tax=Virgisporangium aurantiacum TaxID=175570 RepID=A0A8J4E5G8_9ACTN|nr:hypothetical protein Vau01_105710 [Virgisporangium aurantiacum]